MSKFCFYFGDDIDVIDRLRQAVIFCWGDVEESRLDSFHLFIAAEDFADFSCRTGTVTGAISGYAKNQTDSVREPGIDEFFHEISDREWPLGNEWTGSFAAIAYSYGTKDVTLCNDVIGHFPLYYSHVGNGFIGGTSQIALGRALAREVDAVGVLQRITVPFCNYGRRTLLKEVFRLLPGERLKWNRNGRNVKREYDNSLCSTVTDTDLRSSAKLVWDCLRNEIKASIGNRQEFSIATSGGWDSRLILGGIPKGGFSVNCVTYGGEGLYETHIARVCATAIGASHECFPIEEKYFPSRSQIEELIKETESANYFEWFGIIEKARSDASKTLLLLGDLCESIDGRYMTAFSTRKARVNSFLGGIIGKREFFEKSDDVTFKHWCDEKLKEITLSLLANLKHLSADLTGSLSEKQITEEVANDLKLSFARVSDNVPPFSAMYDELFIWFHRIRFLLGNQINWLSSAFHPASPGLSMRFLRLITTVHPRQRIRKRLMNAIIDLPEFDELSRIPSAQIPFVSSRAPSLIKDVLWGLRSGLDQILIKRTMKNKKAGGRQRVLRSLDYVKEYRRNSTETNVKSWFSDNYIESGDYLQLVRKRADLDAWTLINVDIAAPANVAIILDLCKPETQKRFNRTAPTASFFSTKAR
ncbi:MAG: hypothetical protein HOP17_16895 [Acidobacteria bacterium]|nr:hypothetical protein [Acidobacteriota bacterium]